MSITAAEVLEKARAITWWAEQALQDPMGLAMQYDDSLKVVHYLENEAETLTDELKELVGKIKANVVPNSVLTNAPEDYDYDIVTTNPVLGTAELRLVECKSEWKAKTQADRYASGLYVAIVEPSRQDIEFHRSRS